MMTRYRTRDTVLTDTPDGTATTAIPVTRTRASFERHVLDVAPPGTRRETAASGGAH